MSAWCQWPHLVKNGKCSDLGHRDLLLLTGEIWHFCNRHLGLTVRICVDGGHSFRIPQKKGKDG